MNPTLIFLITGEATLFAQYFLAQNPNLSPNIKAAYQKLISDINADVIAITLASQNPGMALPTVSQTPAALASSFVPFAASPQVVTAQAGAPVAFTQTNQPA